MGTDATTLEAEAGKDEMILAILGKLALYYWRPDFTPGQARQLYHDYLEDLRQFAVEDINNAISQYRQNGSNRFYPTSGQLIDIIIGKADLERDNPGAPDRAQTLRRHQQQAIARGSHELLKIRSELVTRALLASK